MNPAKRPVTMPTAAERLIIALDFDRVDTAREIVRDLSGRVGVFKVGLQLYTAAGPSFVREIVESGAKVFLDLKFHDIPNTVSKAGIEAARLGVWMFNIHASGGREMMQRTVEEVSAVCEAENLRRPKIIAVTVLTSSDANTLRETGIEHSVENQVLNLAKLAVGSGLDGVVASAREASAVRAAMSGPGFLIVTPGVRPEFATNDDQRRVMTPAAALSAGSDYLVVGRPVTQAADRRAAVEQICQEMESALY
jgi:orotidine-5'-phosphate decarboxylase